MKMGESLVETDAALGDIENPLLDRHVVVHCSSMPLWITHSCTVHKEEAMQVIAQPCNGAPLLKQWVLQRGEGSCCAYDLLAAAKMCEPSFCCRAGLPPRHA